MINNILQAVTIQLSTQSFSGNSFHFQAGDVYWQNNELDSLSFPVIWLDDQSIRFRHELTQAGAIKTFFIFDLAFLDKSALDLPPAERHKLIRHMMDAEKEFILRLARSPWLRSSTPNSPIKSANGLLEFNRFDVNLDGVTIRLEIELSELGYDYCTYTPEVIP